MEMKTKNRAWVKNVAIILLAVLLVLTLFSNTFMNRSLPEVATAPVSSDSLTVKVRGTGTVKANGTFDVVANQTRKILAVMVKEGDEVEKGDVLFILGEGDSEELAAATAELKQLQQNYQSTALSYPNHTAEYEIAESRIKKAREDVEAARHALDQENAKVNDKATSTSNQGYTDAFEKYKQDVARYYSLLKDYYYTIFSEVNTMSAQMKKHVDGSLNYSENFTTMDMSKAIEDLQGRVTGLENNELILQKIRLSEEINRLEDENKSIDAALGELENQKTELEAKIRQNDTLISNLNTENASLIASKTGDADHDAEIDAKVAANEGQIEIYKQQNEEAKVTLDGIPNEKTALNEKKDKNIKDIESFDSQLKQVLANSALDEAIKKAKEAKDRYADYIAAFNAIKNDLSKMLIEQEKYLSAISSPEVDAAKQALEAAEQALFEMEKNYESTKASNAKSDAAISLQLRGISDQIEEAKKKVARLSGEADSQIVAEVPGIVNSIFFTAGNTPPAGEKVASLNVSDAGYTLTFNVTAEQAKRLHVGDEASVTNFYWGSTVTAKLTSIKNDPKDPQNTRILSFDLEGDVTPGAELTLAVGSRSMSYDHVVPKNAVRKDNNGTFVLVVKSENTALGNKYTASRMDVTVLAEDDTLAAITGDFEWSAYVITQSSDGTQIKNGDRVRLADS